ncbi:hypothetical protein QQZ08_009679 [Neonectria magnoliae]|uniref:Zn(2)-C6 fungal-type domain-containing protein n=1 Tax=Neonectria magnoliae TaxID=2732573 RepID=A0ABR1HME3_9HYPO
MDSSSVDSSHARAACTECSRRKQKCNRQWPCNHCQKRKVADKCRFKDANQPAAEKAAKETLRKRRLNHDASTESLETEIDEGDSDGIDALGYMPAHVLFGLTASDEIIRASSHEYLKDPKTFVQLERALQVIPPRPYTGRSPNEANNFLNNVNYHYYIIYPPSFLEQYQQWWTARAENRPLGVQWTCLLLMRKLEVDLGDTIQRITESYHEAARDLGSTIPIGTSHLYNVQQLLHSCYWFKSEARFVECWHVLNAAIREAQELSIHQESKGDPVPELELEIRRRIWQISALLGRPMIIDRADCDVGLPNLTVEGMQHSPLTHMKLQSGLIRTLFSRFGLTKNVADPAHVQEYQDILKSWIADFPPPFDVHNPDKSLDAICPWIVLHRHYIRTMAFSMLMDPIRAYLAREYTDDATEDQLKIRSNGIDYCLELMISLRGFFDWVYPRDSKFHFVLFCIFDTSTVLCSAIVHDRNNTLPRKDAVYKAIDHAHAMLERLRMVTKSARISYGILTRIVHRLPRNAVGSSKVGESPATKRARVTSVAITPRSISQGFNTQPLVSPPRTTSSSNGVSIPSSISPSNVPLPSSVSPPNVPFPNAPLSSTISTTGVSQMPGIPPTVVSHVSEDSIFSSEPFPLGGYTPAPPLGDYQIQATPFASEILEPPAAMEQTPQEGIFTNFSEEELGDLATLWHFESLDFNFLDASPPM